MEDRTIRWEKWEIEQHAVFGDGEYYHYDAGAGLLWYFDGKRLMAGDENGKTLYDFTMSEWYKKNHWRKIRRTNIILCH